MRDRSHAIGYAGTVLALALWLAPAVEGAGARRPEPTISQAKRSRPVSGASGEGTGIVQYDPGAPADGFLSFPLTVSMYIVGNLFDTRSGTPLEFPGTVSRVSWYQAESGLAVVGVWLPSWGAPLSTTGLTGGPGFNAWYPSVPVPGPFLAALHALTGGQVPFLPAPFRSASTNGQGFHGAQRNFTGSQAQSLPGRNVMIRASGNLVIPVELIELEVE